MMKKKSTLFHTFTHYSNLQKTGYKIGFKPAGGIRSAKEALTWLALMKEELGDEWTQPNLFRIGASSLLLDIERQLFHFVTGR
jgi:deoxyribose-phosphate aldolase